MVEALAESVYGRSSTGFGLDYHRFPPIRYTHVVQFCGPFPLFFWHVCGTLMFVAFNLLIHMFVALIMFVALGKLLALRKWVRMAFVPRDART